MMTTEKRRRCCFGLVVAPAVAIFVTACGPPGARELRRGEQQIEAGRSSDAIVELKEAVRVLSDAPPAVRAKAWNLLGLACQNSGRSDDAAKAYMIALKLDRNNAAIDYNLGCLQIQRTNFPGAIDYLTTYITLRPTEVQGYLQLGTARFHSALEQRTATERGRLLDAARRDFQNADKASVTAEAANALGMLDLQRRGTDALHTAVGDFKLALQRDANYAPAILNLAILSQQYLNEPAQALKLYRAYLKLTPTPPHTNEVTKLAHDLDLKQRIIITPETAPTRAVAPAPAPNSSSPPSRVASAPPNPAPATQKPPPPESPPVQASVPALAPTSVPVAPPSSSPPPSRPPVSSPPASNTQTPAVVSTNINTVDSAPEAVVPATTPQPHKTITQRLNPLNWFSGKPKTNSPAGTAEAEPPPLPAGSHYDYPPAVTPIPGDRAQAERYEIEAIRAKREGDMARSMRAYKEAAAADPTFYNASYGLGLTAMEARDYATALEALHRALALQEDSAEARYAFAWALQRRGYTEDAVHELGKLVAQHPNEARAHLLLGSLYAEKLHQPKLAREQFMATLQLDPTNPQAETIRSWLKLNP